MRLKNTLRNQIDAFLGSKDFLDKDCFYFFDWFCKDQSLENKAKTLMPRAIAFVRKMDIDLDRHYVTFKNNCPVNGRLYDDFRICSIDDDRVIYTVIPSSGHTSIRGKAEVWCMFNDFKEPIYSGESWGALLGELN